MKITLTTTQKDELQALIISLTKVQNQGSTEGEIAIGTTKVEYNANSVEFTISD